MDISVVIPVYGCPEALDELHRRLVQSLSAMGRTFEIILVNDACPKGSWEGIKRIALKDARVKGVDLSRNFGQIRAITAGLEFATGDWVVVMDCDLQDKPEEIVKLYDKAQEGFDIVFSRRVSRKDTFTKKLSSKIFSMIYGYFTSGALDSSICNFSITRKMVMENYRRIGDQNRAFIPFIKWMGFKSTAISIDHDKRAAGKSSYTLKKQIRLALEIITTQSNKPLILSIKIGFSVALLALLYGLVQIFRYYVSGITVTGWTSTIVSIYFVGGILMAQLGVVGLYLGYIFDQTKNRPLFIVRELIENQISKLGGK